MIERQVDEWDEPAHRSQGDEAQRYETDPPKPAHRSQEFEPNYEASNETRLWAMLDAIGSPESRVRRRWYGYEVRMASRHSASGVRVYRSWSLGRIADRLGERIETAGWLGGQFAESGSGATQLDFRLRGKI